jgi:5-methylcytosine-specific restriction endonuclease McrA
MCFTAVQEWGSEFGGAMLIKWSATYLKHGKFPRESFRSWSIPKRKRERFRLPDGLLVEIQVALGTREWTQSVKLTSGGEFAFSAEDHPEIERYWRQHQDLRLVFVLDLSRNAPTIDVLNLLLSTSISRTKRHRTKEWPERPDQYLSLVRLFSRNPFVVEEVLERSKGICEVCGTPAPFRRLNGKPYLEVHHLQWLSHGGGDIVENAFALCLNCHREAHYGDPAVFSTKLPDLLKGLRRTEPTLL